VKLNKLISDRSITQNLAWSTTGKEYFELGLQALNCFLGYSSTVYLFKIPNYQCDYMRLWHVSGYPL